MIRVAAFALLLICPVAAADVPAEHQAEVEHLITTLETSDCVMVRSGKQHDGREAADHVRRKYERYRDQIGSTEDFITYSATKSLMSGRAYQVQCPGEDPQTSADWLLAELETYRASTVLEVWAPAAAGFRTQKPQSRLKPLPQRLLIFEDR